MGFFDKIKKLSPAAARKSASRFPADMKGPDGNPMVAEGPFAIATAEGRLICKNCGTTFDAATVRQAQATYAAESHPDRLFTHFCRKCSTHSVILREDIADLRALPGMTSTPLNQRTMGSGNYQVKFIVAGPLPIFDPEGQLLCRLCGMPFDEAAYDAWRNNIEKFLDMLTSNGTIVVQCTNCKAANAYAIGNDERLRPFIAKLAATLPD